MEAYWGDASTNKEPQGLRPPPEARRVGSPERAWPCGRPASGSGLGRGGGSSRCPRPGVWTVVGRPGSWCRTPGPRPAALAPAGLPRLARGSPWKSLICPLRGVRVHVGGSGRAGAVSPVMVQAARLNGPQGRRPERHGARARAVSSTPLACRGLLDLKQQQGLLWKTPCDLTDTLVRS